RGDPVAAVGDDFALTIPLHRVGRWRQGVGAHAVPRLPGFIAQTTAQARQRLPRLRQIDGLEVFDDAADAQGTWPFLLLLLPDQTSRDRALEQLGKAGSASAACSSMPCPTMPTWPASCRRRTYPTHATLPRAASASATVRG